MATKVKTGAGTSGKPRQAKTSKPKAGSTNKKKQTGNAGTIIMTSIALGAAGIAGYFGWQYLKKRKTTQNDIDITLPDDNIIIPVKPVKPVKETPKPPGPKTKAANDGFPLKKGSKGERVRMLQQAIIDKNGSGALPKFGADGDFGSETAAALKKYNIPNPVTESAFNLLTQAGSAIDAAGLAKQLHSAASAKNYNSVLSLLKNLKNKQDYQSVSNSFLPLRLRGVRQTLVNGLLSSFANAAQKHSIGMEFIRMGLQYDGNKYSLSGFGGQPVVTTEPAIVWVNAMQNIQVPASMVLGNEVARRLDYTLFENNSKYFLVKTQSIKYL